MDLQEEDEKGLLKGIIGLMTLREVFIEGPAMLVLVLEGMDITPLLTRFMVGLDIVVPATVSLSFCLSFRPSKVPLPLADVVENSGRVPTRR